MASNKKSWASFAGSLLLVVLLMLNQAPSESQCEIDLIKCLIKCNLGVAICMTGCPAKIITNSTCFFDCQVDNLMCLEECLPDLAPAPCLAPH